MYYPMKDRIVSRHGDDDVEKDLQILNRIPRHAEPGRTLGRMQKYQMIGATST